jgi:uncharacterized protein
MSDATGAEAGLTGQVRRRTAAPGLDAPRAPEQRWLSVDALRGAAVLGILLVNIPTFALPMAAFYRPPAWGGFTGADFASWLVTHVFFEFKFITIFSMLFGAGLVLIADRAAGTGRSPAGAYYTRLAWLAVFGLAHMWLLWYGDILFAYALWGMLLYPLRRAPAEWLLAIGGALFALWMPLMSLLGLMVDTARTHDPGSLGGIMPTPEESAAEIAAMNGTFWQALKVRAEHILFMQLGGQLVFYPWRVFGVMLIGMGLMKLGVFTAQRSTRFYAWCVAAGYGLGLPLVAAGVVRLLRHDFDIAELYKLDWHFNYAGSLGVALGHVGVVMLAVKSGVLGGVTARLAAVGRMALTNYLAQSVVGAFIFTGWGLGQFGQVSRTGLVAIALGIWAAQLAWSPWWLSRFRFGPMEWAWRTLTYGRAPSMRRGGPGSGASEARGYA